MHKQIKKYFRIFAFTILFLVVIIVARMIQINVEYQRSMERIGLILNAEATILGFSKAIPNQFEIGSSREEVMEKVFEIFPDIDVNSYNHGFWVCNAKGCADYIAFYDNMFGLELAFRFRYDDSENLTAVEYAPGS